MKLISKPLLVFLFLSAPLAALAGRHDEVVKGGGGSIIGNGGGRSEQNFAYSWTVLDQLWALCIQTPSCNLTADERMWFKAIRDLIPLEQKEGKLEFLSGEKNPDIFRDPVTGHMRMIVTSSTPLAPVRVNLDLIYPETAFGQTTSMTADQTGAVLVVAMLKRVAKMSATEEADLRSRLLAAYSLTTETLTLAFRLRPDMAVTLLQLDQTSRGRRRSLRRRRQGRTHSSHRRSLGFRRYRLALPPSSRVRVRQSCG